METMKSEAGAGRRRESSPISLFSEWVQQGVDSYVATQRIMLDLVMRQNATTMNALREKIAVARPTSPGMVELAGEGMSNFIEAQRILLNLALRQNEILMTGVKGAIGGGRGSMLVSLLQRSVETFIDMQQHFLTIAEKKTDAWMKDVKTGRTDAGHGLADLAREGMEQFVRSQKKMLDVIAEETAKGAEPSKNVAHGNGTKLDITELARQSAESLIDMQKKLLDVAGKQVNLNLKTARRAIEMTPSPRMDLADLAHQYVENFVHAQKALLDLMLKPRPAVPGHPITPAPDSERPVPRRSRRAAKSRRAKPAKA